MHVLITGVGGYVGSTLADILLAEGHRVTGMDCFFFGKSLLGDLLEDPHFKLLQRDIRTVSAEDFDGVDGVCDLAALSNDPAGEIDPQLTVAINHLGRARVARTAKDAGVKRYVLAGSCSVYGQGQGQALDETASLNPITTYARTGAAAEAAVLPLADDSFCVTVLRQATLFGLSRRMRFDLVLNIMTLNAFEKRKIMIEGGGKQWRPLVHVRDAARAFAAVMNADPSEVCGEIFNVGGDNKQIIDLGHLVRDTLPFAVDLHVKREHADTRDYNVSFAKIRRVLGYETTRTLADGVREICAALEHGLRANPTSYTVAWYKHILETVVPTEQDGAESGAYAADADAAWGLPASLASMSRALRMQMIT
jgi:nucleoside-diphosphate-sugar epimerase